MDDYDLVIVGGGIGGSALAAVMAGAGRSVLLLEQSETYQDRVRGEWIAPWGVDEVKRVGLYDLLLGAGGHHLTRHVTYDEHLDPAVADAAPTPLGLFRAGVPGPLCIGHPHHCQTLFDAAGAAGAETLRGVRVTEAIGGESPQVTFELGDRTRTVSARLVIGADGRTSQVRETAGIVLHQDTPHHWFAGLLVEGVDEWPDDLQAIGTEGDFGFLAFPQGGGRVRVYGGYALDEAKRFKGPDGPRRFLDAFAMQCSPGNRHIAAGRPAGPLFSYINADAWTDAPLAPGVVLVGDAAGWNDPIIGLGLSITYRDVRIVSDILKAGDDWSETAFAPYAEERAERMRRLRFAAQLQSALDMEFGPDAAARRRSYYERGAVDPTLKMHGFAVMAGPEAAPPETFTEAHRARVLGA
ncbi:MAG: FAD-dependent monooxygenase [Alphaproteobacteria bacterium]|nr:FAD-dependent monooxygenase [Alphaproteobacteria bacterium]MBU1512855.1 FAD-dependent monooxygenase [Alphaproteobacteria bacterium]MBU2096704.1 FAD-dependent monooxygenase [Alphaproteobacteria bacterium]MBU2150587.1 FAD-dependent monooxygenase [Alphaproteobacteria bacterium]MBU2308085.1 FAD-dependent monooxygenase [Alphaproteobacteria bacterium]